MHSRPRFICGALLLVLASASLSPAPCAQTPRPPVSPALLADIAPPLHRAAGEESQDAAWWAVRRDYKAELRSGFEFIPVLGAEFQDRLSLRWTTRSVRLGSQSLVLAPSPRVVAEGDRCEFRHAQFIERYDVHPEGLEQSFVIHASEQPDGDLEVLGRIATSLRPDACADEHRAVTFRDSLGRAILSVGAATAIDARGRVFPMTTSVDGTTLRYVLPATELGGATFPITVDPLIANTWLATTNDPAALITWIDVAVAGDLAGTDRRIGVAWSRTVTQSDVDTFVSTFRSDWTGRVDVFSVISGTPALEPSLAFHGPTQQWCLAYSKGRYIVETYFHPVTEPFTNLGAFLPLQFSSAWTRYLRPRISTSRTSGSPSGVLVAYDREELVGVVQQREVVGVLIDPVALTRSQDLQLAAVPAGNDFDRNQVAIAEAGGDLGDGWLVVWRELMRNVPSDRWRVHGVRLDRYGSATGRAVLADLPGAHVLNPQVAGRAGRYLLAFGVSSDPGSTTASSIEAGRIDWPVFQIPTLLPRRNVASLSGGIPGTGLVPSDLSHDEVTRSHWTLCYTRIAFGGLSNERSLRVAMLGHSAGTVQSAVLVQSNSLQVADAHAAFDPVTGAVMLAWGTSGSLPNGARNPLYGDRLTRSAASVSVTGASCGPSSASADTPHAGHEFCGLRLSGAPGWSLAVLLLGFAPLATPLDVLGMNGCVLHCSVDLSFPLVTRGDGSAEQILAIPDAPPLVGDLWAQFAHQATGQNPFGWATTHALRMHLE
ncbi:MAG: hypothetical protein IT457_07365 [Planctomycetes bacterium]|nr:hypothetical protein [Planctomycetota bacterium]